MVYNMFFYDEIPLGYDPDKTPENEAEELAIRTMQNALSNYPGSMTPDDAVEALRGGGRYGIRSCVVLVRLAVSISTVYLFENVALRKPRLCADALSQSREFLSESNSCRRYECPLRSIYSLHLRQLRQYRPLPRWVSRDQFIGRIVSYEKSRYERRR